MFLRYSLLLLLITGIISCGKNDKTGKPLIQDKIVNDTIFSNTSDPNLLTPYDSVNDLKNAIPVGLLIMKHPEGKDISLSAWQAAELAINEANNNGGFNGKHFKLIVRSCDGPWGTGSKQTVNMVFTDQVVAILGAVDGRNSHLIEQVIAKTHVPAMGCLATEPTITEAFVPWFFRCVPNDRQQAELLSEYIYAVDKSLKVNIITFGEYDSRNAANAFIKMAKDKGLKIPLNFEHKNNDIGIVMFADSILLSKPDAVIFFGRPAQSREIINNIREVNSSLQVYGNTWMYYGDTINSRSEAFISGLQIIAPFYMISSAAKKFTDNFKNLYGYSPDLAAAYVYDGMHLIIKAINAVGTDRQKIRDRLALIEYKQGVTGSISFDKHGNLLIRSLTIKDSKK